MLKTKVAIVLSQDISAQTYNGIVGVDIKTAVSHKDGSLTYSGEYLGYTEEIPAIPATENSEEIPAVPSKAYPIKSIKNTTLSREEVLSMYSAVASKVTKKNPVDFMIECVEEGTKLKMIQDHGLTEEQIEKI